MEDLAEVKSRLAELMRLGGSPAHSVAAVVDPSRWSKTRYDVIRREEFTCASCGLDVYHTQLVVVAKSPETRADSPASGFTTSCVYCLLKPLS